MQNKETELKGCSGVSPLSQGEQQQRRDATATCFSPEQLSWLCLIRDHITTSLSIDSEDFELAPFNQRGGIGKAHQLFGEHLPELLEDLNAALAS